MEIYYINNKFKFFSGFNWLKLIFYMFYKIIYDWIFGCFFSFINFIINLDILVFSYIGLLKIFLFNVMFCLELGFWYVLLYLFVMFFFFVLLMFIYFLDRYLMINFLWKFVLYFILEGFVLKESKWYCLVIVEIIFEFNDYLISVIFLLFVFVKY